MHYVSTRGAAPTLGFADALLAGLARDGGLYRAALRSPFAAGRDPGAEGRSVSGSGGADHGALRRARISIRTK